MDYYCSLLRDTKIMGHCLLNFCLIAALLAGCSLPKTNFSQYPGFAEYYAAHPPTTTRPSDAEQTLLARYRPRFFLPPGHAGMIDFYADYIAHGTLNDAAGRAISSNVDGELLNRHRDDSGVVFVHAPAKSVAKT